MSKFLRFAVLSGCGWLLDLCVLLILVRVGRAPPSLANVVSSTTAASAVFLTSRVLIFDRVTGGLHTRFALFLAYTMCVILIASAAIGALAEHMAPLGALLGIQSMTATETAAISKVIVTPPQLLLNFAVSRVLSERAALRAGGLGG